MNQHVCDFGLCGAPAVGKIVWVATDGVLFYVCEEHKREIETVGDKSLVEEMTQ